MLGKITKRVVQSANLDEKHLEADEMKEIVVNSKGERFKFTSQFVCLESIVASALDSIVDTKHRIMKALKVIGMLKLI